MRPSSGRLGSTTLATSGNRSGAGPRSGALANYDGRSVVFSGETRPSHPLIDAWDGAGLLVRETFPSTPVFAQKAGVPLGFAEQVVNGAHTSPMAAGRVFARAGARMSVMWTAT